jgi:hypothetical protein
VNERQRSSGAFGSAEFEDESSGSSKLAFQPTKNGIGED